MQGFQEGGDGALLQGVGPRDEPVGQALLDPLRQHAHEIVVLIGQEDRKQSEPGAALVASTCTYTLVLATASVIPGTTRRASSRESTCSIDSMKYTSG